MFIQSFYQNKFYETTVVVDENQISLYLCPNWWQEPKEHSCNMTNDELIL